MISKQRASQTDTLMSLEHPLVSDTANIAFFLIFVVNHGVILKHRYTKWYAKTDYMRQ